MYLSANWLKKLTIRPALMFLSLMSMSVFAADPSQRWQTNMSPGVTELGQNMYDIHMIVFWISVAIGILVFGAMAYIIFFHRKSKGHQPSDFHESTVVELAWTIIPFFILGAMAIPATESIVKVYDTKDSDVDILITGYQWKWKYEYLSKVEGGKNFSFLSNLATPRDVIYGDSTTRKKRENYLLEVDEPILIPVNKKTRFLVTGGDVIHAWWVPDLAVKKDATPGFINETWTRPTKTGIFRGQCAELCGKDHGFMPIVVKVVEQAEFDTWVAEKSAGVNYDPLTHDQLMEMGKSLYERTCAGCHMPTGEGIPGAFPALKGSAIATGDIKNHLGVVVKGRAGTAMAAFGTQLNDLDLAAIITYERNAWGNNTGDTVQAVDLKNFKSGQ